MEGGGYGGGGWNPGFHPGGGGRRPAGWNEVCDWHDPFGYQDCEPWDGGGDWYCGGGGGDTETLGGWAGSLFTLLERLNNPMVEEGRRPGSERHVHVQVGVYTAGRPARGTCSQALSRSKRDAK